MKGRPELETVSNTSWKVVSVTSSEGFSSFLPWSWTINLTQIVSKWTSMQNIHARGHPAQNQLLYLVGNKTKKNI